MRCLFFALVVHITTVSSLVVLSSPGPYDVSMFVESFVDDTRIDPYAAGNQTRQVMISMFVPINDSIAQCERHTVSYMTPLVAEAYNQQAALLGLPNDTFSSLELELGSCIPPPVKSCRRKTSKRPSQFPVLLFSPGAGNPRLLYGAMAQTIASFGFVVVTVDHPHEASVVEFPTGEVIYAADFNDTDNAALTLATNIRAGDMSFVMDKIQDRKFLENITGWLSQSIDTDRVIVGGHSLGGATSATAMLSDSRFLAGINLDGQITEPAEDRGLSSPFFLVGRPGHREEDPTWDIFWDNLRGPKSQLAVSGAVHGTFTDLPILLAALATVTTPVVKSGLENIAGSMDWHEVGSTMAAVFGAVYSYVSGQSVPELLEIGDRSYSEIKVVNSNLTRIEKSNTAT